MIFSSQIKAKKIQKETTKSSKTNYHTVLEKLQKEDVWIFKFSGRLLQFRKFEKKEILFAA